MVLIITADNLTYMERLYYFLADLYSSLNESLNGVRETEKSGLEWAKLLDCSEEWVFKMQKSLENKGYFSIIREKDEDNQNEKNIIIPTLPDNVFDELAKTPNRFGKEYLVFVKVSKGLVNIKIFVEDLIFVELNKFGLNIILSFTFKNNSLPSYIPLFGNSGIIGYPGKLAIRTSLPLIVIFV